MKLSRASRIGAASLAALCLNGCIAAALPALAGAALVRSDGDKEDTEAEAETAMTVATPTPAAAQPAASADTTALAAAPPTPAPLPENVIIGPAPPPVSTPAQSQPGDAAYAKLFEFALSPVKSRERMSAVLRNPSSLDGKRTECRAANPVVLIDLDPQDGRLNPDAAPMGSASMAAGLQSLRARDISIAWISQSTAADAGDIRAALRRTGLDPDGKDRLILMRYPGDRKQTRREELARESCLIAIAGDHRSDFDELFEYLVNPEAALGLELLIGEGWFLVPPVLGAQ